MVWGSPRQRMSWIFDADDGELELILTTSSSALNKIEWNKLSEIIMFHAHLVVNRKLDRESDKKEEIICKMENQT